MACGLVGVPAGTLRPHRPTVTLTLWDRWSFFIHQIANSNH